MTDPLDGFAFSVTSPDVNSPGGRRARTLFVIARGLDAAKALARSLVPAAIFQSKGPNILVKARELGVGDNDGKLCDGALASLL